MSKFFSTGKVRRWSIASTIVIVSVFLLTSWTRTYNNPVNVFWGMLDNSLSTGSVTKHVFQSSPDQSLDRYTFLTLGAQNASLVKETRRQNDGISNSIVTQEIIGTPETDYVRFPFISTNALTATGQPPDYSKIQGVWGRSDGQLLAGGLPVQNFNQALLGTVPIGLLSHKNRRMLLDYIHDHNVYDVDFENVGKRKENGHGVYVYGVQVNAKEYFSMLQKFADLMGMGQISTLEPNRYETVAPLNVEFTVAIDSRQLQKIHYEASSQDETYDSYGVTQLIDLPTKTITITELEKRIQSL